MRAGATQWQVGAERRYAHLADGVAFGDDRAALQREMERPDGAAAPVARRLEDVAQRMADEQRRRLAGRAFGLLESPFGGANRLVCGGVDADGTNRIFASGAADLAVFTNPSLLAAARLPLTLCLAFLATTKRAVRTEHWRRWLLSLVVRPAKANQRGFDST